jgi:rhodanese-related sulfurtransferase
MSNTIPDIDIYNAKYAIDNDEVLLLDVREVDEYQAAHIDKAVLVPLSQFNFAAVPDTTLPIVVYCRSGKRSAHVCQMLLERNPNAEVYNLRGGILAWSAAGFAV